MSDGPGGVLVDMESNVETGRLAVKLTVEQSNTICMVESVLRAVLTAPDSLSTLPFQIGKRGFVDTGTKGKPRETQLCSD